MSLPTRERGLKFYRKDNRVIALDVAPHAGARIEINSLGSLRPSQKSLPTRERGLKSNLSVAYAVAYRSLPTRERGLKFLRSFLMRIVLQSLPTRERGLKYLLHDFV